MDREDGADSPEALATRREFALQEIERGMPVVQVYRVGQGIQGVDPARYGGTEESELVRVGGIRTQRTVVMVDASRFGRHHHLVLEQHGANRLHDQFERAHRVHGTAEPDLERRQLGGAGQAVKCTVRRREHGGVTSLPVQSARQVADDVADAADLATGQRAVLRGNEKDVLGSDSGLPQVNA